MSVLFVCASPRGRQSSSTWLSEYVEAALPPGIQAGRVLLPEVGLDEGMPDDDPRWLELLDRIRAAHVVVWVLPSYTFGVPSALRLLFDRLLSRTTPADFAGRGAAALLASARYQDDRVLERLRLVSEQLGLGWLGDASVDGNPVKGFEHPDEAVRQARRIARDIARSIRDGQVPPPRSLPLDRSVLAPGPARAVPFAAARADLPEAPGIVPAASARPPILVLAGTSPQVDAAVQETIDHVRAAATQPVEVLDLSGVRLQPCTGCYTCNTDTAGRCPLPDALHAVRGRMARAGAVVMVSRAGAAMPDLALRRLAERMWGDCHRPPFQGIPGAVAVIRGGPVADRVLDDLSLFLSLVGCPVVAAWTDAPADPSSRRLAVAHEVRRLELAMSEGIPEPARYGVASSRLAFRDLALRWSFYLRADYRYHRVHGLLKDRPRWPQFLLRLLARSRRAFRGMMSGGRRHAARRHAARIQALQAGAKGNVP